MSDSIIPQGISLRHTLEGQAQTTITRIAWSPNGRMLASPCQDGTISLWDTYPKWSHSILRGHTDSVNCVVWSPSHTTMFASCSDDQTIKLWNAQWGIFLPTQAEHQMAVNTVAYISDGNKLISGSDDGTTYCWIVQENQDLLLLVEAAREYKNEITHIVYAPHKRLLAISFANCIYICAEEQELLAQITTSPALRISSLAWSADEQLLAIGSNDGTISLWLVDTQNREAKIPLQHEGILEGHTDYITSLSFSADGLLLASKSRDGTVRLWRTDTWQTVAVIEEPASGNEISGLAFHPRDPVLATLGEEDTVLRIWDLDISTLLTMQYISPSSLYKNAKVVLVGDSGVGKSGLGLALTGQLFVPTESTHGRHVWTFENQRRQLEDQSEEIQEILLWDLAGQPGYRLIHQLHLNEVTVALIVIDTRSETDPFAGVQHWARALRVAQLTQNNGTAKMKIFLVSARQDRGGLAVSRERIAALVQELNFGGFFETSAKEHTGIVELTAAIKQAIDWSILPKISSTQLFQQIKTFLVSEKEAGRILTTSVELYLAFLIGSNRQYENIQAHFETCIEQMDTQGIIRTLSVGNLVLLQPELIDAYASALVNAVRDDPDGLGSILEEYVRNGNFFIPQGERLLNAAQEKLLLIAMTEDLLRNEIVLRERTNEGPFLVFPSQSTREQPELPDQGQKTAVFHFEGPIQNIYATLAVRLSHSGLFKYKELWRNAITYTTEKEGICGLILHNIAEGRAALTLFFDGFISTEIRQNFEEYVHEHLRRRALAESIQLLRILVCAACGEPFTNAQVQRRRQRGFDTISCSVCDTLAFIGEKDAETDAKSLAVVSAMNRSADTLRESEVSISQRSGLRAHNPYSMSTPIRDPAMFFGRTKILRRLFSAVTRHQSISIVGTLRIGKTSLLLQICHPQIQQQCGYDFRQYLFVFVDLQAFLVLDSERFLHTVSKEIVERAQGRLLIPQAKDGEEIFRNILEQASQQNMYIVLLMDEFDSTTRMVQADSHFFSFLRAQATRGKISYVTSSLKPINEIISDAIEGSPFFNIFGEHTLGPLTREEADEMIRNSSKQTGHPFTDAEVAWIISLAGTHPAFIQHVCYLLLEEKMVTDETVEFTRIKARAYSELFPTFHSIWEQIQEEEQEALQREILLANSTASNHPELSGSSLFRDFVLEEVGAHTSQIDENELEKLLQRINDHVFLGESHLRYFRSVTRRLKSGTVLQIEVVRAVQGVLSEAHKKLGGKGLRDDTARDWLYYNILYYRYFRFHLPNEQIAGRLSISTRQYHRERKKAIGALLNALLEMEVQAQSD